jgi:hypothetical protein
MARSGTVTFRGTSASNITGTTSFYNLTINTSTDGAKTVNFGASQTQTITHTLTLTGASGKVLTINSSDGTNYATLSIPASISSGVNYVSVSHNHIAGSNTITVDGNSTLVTDYTPGWTQQTASKVVFYVQPANTVYGDAIDSTTGVQIEIQNASGQRVTAGTYSVTIAIGTNPSSGVISGTLTVDSVGGIATFSDLKISKVGNGYTLTASSTGLTGATSSTFNITQRPITVTAVKDSKKYDGNTSSSLTPTITSGTLASGDTVTWTQTYDNRNVGYGKTLTPAGTVTDGNSGNNYSVTFANITDGVIARDTANPLTITAATDTKTYDGTVTSSATPTVIGLQAGDSVTGLTQIFDTENVGSGITITVNNYTVNDGAGGLNYYVTVVSGTGTITAKNLTVTGITADNKAYDGNTNATINTAGAALVGVVGSDLVALNTSGATGTFSSAAPGTGKTVTISGLTISGADTGNYSLVQPTTTANITALTSEWTGAISTEWNDPANWSNGFVPTSVDAAVIPVNPTRMPDLVENVSIESLSVANGDTLTTNNFNITTTDNTTLNGTISASSSNISVGGNLTGSGTITGVSPNLSVNGVIGSRADPIDTSITGTLRVYAGGMQDNSSVFLSGSGNYSWSESIPGFVFTGGNLNKSVGQASIRQKIEQGDSVLFRTLLQPPGFQSNPYILFEPMYR